MGYEALQKLFGTLVGRITLFDWTAGSFTSTPADGAVGKLVDDLILCYDD